MLIKKILFWIPRSLLILLALFVSLFALDVFAENWSIGEKIIAFLIQLIPGVLIMFLTWQTWKKGKAAGWIFLALFVIFFFFFDFYESWGGMLAIGLPMLMISGLFFIEGHRTNK